MIRDTAYVIDSLELAALNAIATRQPSKLKL